MTKEGLRRTANVVITALVAMLALSIWGCSSIGKLSAAKSPLGPDGLPRDEYLVGGGFQIDWVAPADGTAYLVMSGAEVNKLIQTEYLKEAEKFDFSMSVSSPEEIEQIEKVLGAKMSEVRFSLYFVPSPQKEKTIEQD